MKKIPKSLLSAIAAGVLMGTTVSCENFRLFGAFSEEIEHLESCPEDCTSRHGKKYPPINCPTCGMG